MIVGQMWSLKRSSGAVIPLSFLYFRDNYSSLRVSISLCLFRGFPPTATYEWKLLQSQRRCLYFQRFTFKLNVNDYIPERATWRWVESELGCMWFVCVRLEVVKRTPEDWCGTVRATFTAGSWMKADLQGETSSSSWRMMALTSALEYLQADESERASPTTSGLERAGQDVRTLLLD